TMDYVMAGRHAELGAEITARLAKRTHAEEEIVATRAEKLANPTLAATPGVRSDVSTTVPVPKAPFLGSRVVQEIDLDHIYPFINPIALFRGQWQIKKGATSDEEYEALIEDEVRPIFQKWKDLCKREAILRPAVVYGYFACNSEGNDLIICAPKGEKRERLRFSFPRQTDKRRLCISDFFRSTASGETDVLAMHCVTMGSRASEYARDLFASNNYTDYLYLHGLGVETAEALAEFWHKRMRQELGIAGEDSPKVRDLFTQKYRGSRYSFGYPACPSMEDQEKLFSLLEPQRIGCVLTENWQIDPEQSTSAIVVHHPEAKYFGI
ncbi:MAG: vitamin B12 dependent-methionine synthase activation domain-containing protein, partial [Phycisphaerales bacterium]